MGKVKSVTPEGYKVQAVIGVKSTKMCAFVSASPYNAVGPESHFHGNSTPNTTPQTAALCTACSAK